MSPEFITILLAASPLSELRGAIPYAVGVAHFSLLKAFTLGVLGNVIPILPLLFLVYYGSTFLSLRSAFVKNFLERLFSYTRRRHSQYFEKWSGRGASHHFLNKDFLIAFALFVFVAIPLPLTGAWSGVLAGFVFGVPLSRAAIAVSLGVVVAGIVVTLASAGIFTFIRL